MSTLKQQNKHCLATSYEQAHATQAIYRPLGYAYKHMKKMNVRNNAMTSCTKTNHSQQPKYITHGILPKTTASLRHIIIRLNHYIALYVHNII